MGERGRGGWGRGHALWGGGEGEGRLVGGGGVGGGVLWVVVGGAVDVGHGGGRRWVWGGHVGSTGVVRSVRDGLASWNGRDGRLQCAGPERVRRRAERAGRRAGRGVRSLSRTMCGDGSTTSCRRIRQMHALLRQVSTAMAISSPSPSVDVLTCSISIPSTHPLPAVHASPSPSRSVPTTRASIFLTAQAWNEQCFRKTVICQGWARARA